MSDTQEYNVWIEYDRVAEDMARKGLNGTDGDRLPANISSACMNEIHYDPEAFQRRIRESAYALGMAEVMP